MLVCIVFFSCSLPLPLPHYTHSQECTLIYFSVNLHSRDLYLPNYLSAVKDGYQWLPLPRPMLCFGAQAHLIYEINYREAELV